ncbi:hypothetical protein [Elizabethkingia anophelis]|uniref:hypothetical protein n=1 Tax=Elizabethkingia anophelis TaxID=1117645 RepID=UPI0020117FE6|nr:hypothetical protein [Elizabethkingia anophelis]MCL1690405.1 hypothetical protein [Elizabethkingia anophelis]
MAKVKLLKSIGDHPEGSTIDIKDQTVLDAWAKLGIISQGKSKKAEEDTEEVPIDQEEDSENKKSEEDSKKK